MTLGNRTLLRRPEPAARPRRGFLPRVDCLEPKIAPGSFLSVTQTALQVIGLSQRWEYGQPVTLSATVTNGRDYLLPVEFFDGSTRLEGVGPSWSQTNPSEVIANYTTSSLSVGTHTLTARFTGGVTQTPGDPSSTTSYAASTSDPITLTIAPVPSSTSAHVGQSNATPGFGKDTTLYAVIANNGGTAPTGSVRFLEGNTVVGTADLHTVNGQTSASLTTDALSRNVGGHAITVAFDGDEANRSSVSEATTITVAPNTATAAGQDNATPELGQTITLYAVVAHDGSGDAPTGSVVFLDGSTVLGSSTLTTVPGQTNTSLPITTLTAGSHTILMYYTGDSANSPSAATTSITVGPTSFPIYQ